MTEKFDSDFGLLSNTSNDIFPNENIFDGGTDTGNDVQPDDIIIIYMDIREPLSKLKILLEQKVGMTLKKYKFWLQDAQMLEPHKNLVDQCVEGEGIVQINVQLQTINRRINVVDVLKPTEESLEFLANESSLPDTKPPHGLKSDDNRNNNTDSSDDDNDDDGKDDGGTRNRDHYDDDDSNDIIKNVLNDDELTPKWILDNDCKFKKDQAKLNIPDDPSEWTTAQVHHWLQWAVREFHMTQIKFSDWIMTGKQLCEMPLSEFDKIVPHDPGNIFRTHFELLRKCKFVAVLQNRRTLDLKIFGAENIPKPVKVLKKMPKKLTAIVGDEKFYMTSDTTIHRNPAGQIQLWQFLLDLLTDYEYRSIIHWISPDGEFRLADPEQVAKLWGLRKNKPSMNYEKLSRALRYYYDGDMISKVHGKRFVYKFVCNLKQLIGYDARELARLIAHCVMMKKKERTDKNSHNI